MYVFRKIKEERERKKLCILYHQLYKFSALFMLPVCRWGLWFKNGFTVALTEY